MSTFRLSATGALFTRCYSLLMLDRVGPHSVNCRCTSIWYLLLSIRASGVSGHYTTAARTTIELLDAVSFVYIALVKCGIRGCPPSTRRYVDCASFACILVSSVDPIIDLGPLAAADEIAIGNRVDRLLLIDSLAFMGLTMQRECAGKAGSELGMQQCRSGALNPLQHNHGIKTGDINVTYCFRLEIECRESASRRIT